MAAKPLVLYGLITGLKQNHWSCLGSLRASNRTTGLVWAHYGHQTEPLVLSGLITGIKQNYWSCLGSLRASNRTTGLVWAHYGPQIEPLVCLSSLRASNRTTGLSELITGIKQKQGRESRGNCWVGGDQQSQCCRGNVPRQSCECVCVGNLCLSPTDQSPPPHTHFAK